MKFVSEYFRVWRKVEKRVGRLTGMIIGLWVGAVSITISMVIFLGSVPYPYNFLVSFLFSQVLLYAITKKVDEVMG